jgi:thiamine pyrophosphokinase
VPAAIVFAAASLAPTPRLRSILAHLESPFIVAADAGALTALAFGFTPNVVVGDFDSLDADALTQLRERNIPVEQHPRDKDATDGQLAVERALREQPTELLLLGFLGGQRLDQALANILMLTRVEVPTVLLDERNEARLLRPGTVHLWAPDPSETISLIPLTEAVRGVRTEGLHWPLHGETLRRGETRGISNAAAGPEARVSIGEGLLLLTRHFV